MSTSVAKTDEKTARVVCYVINVVTKQCPPVTSDPTKSYLTLEKKPLHQGDILADLNSELSQEYC